MVIIMLYVNIVMMIIHKNILQCFQKVTQLYPVISVKALCWINNCCGVDEAICRK